MAQRALTVTLKPNLSMLGPDPLCWKEHFCGIKLDGCKCGYNYKGVCVCADHTLAGIF